MRILLTSVYHASYLYGGNEHYTHQLALGLASKGHQVTYLTGFAQSSKKSTYPYSLLIRRPVSVFNKPLPSIHWLNPSDQSHFDLIHATGSGLPLTSLCYAFKQRGRPTILTYQAPTNPVNPFFKLGAKLENHSLRYSYSAFITTSPHNQKMLSAHYPTVPAFFVPLMISPAFSAKTPPRHLARKNLKATAPAQILFVGQLDDHHYYKGLPVLLEALSLLPPTIKLTVIGTGNQKKNYESISISLGVGDRVEFKGAVPNANLPLHMAAADVLVLPSVNSSEGFGMVLLEAMACGTPTITTHAVGAASYFKNHSVTTLVPPQNSHALAQAIQNTISQPDPSKLKRAKQFALKHNLNFLVSNTLKVYAQVSKNV